MTTPPTIQTNPLDPVFSGVPITFPQTGTVNPTWDKWFVDLREKVNVINQTLTTLSGGSVDPSTGALAISSGGTGATTVAGAQTNLGILANPMTDAGDIIIGGTGGTPTRLPGGSNTYVLTMVGGVPAWAAGGGGGGGGGGPPFLNPLTPPTAANFTASSSYLTLATKTARMQLVANYVATMTVATYTTALPSPPYTIDLGFSFPQVIPANNNYTGLFISDGTKYINFQFILYPGSSYPYAAMYIGEYATLGGSATYLLSLWLSYQTNFFRITDDGTTRRYWVSTNGLDYVQVYSHATNTYLTPIKCGIVSWCNNATLASYKVTAYHWLVSNSVLGDAP